MIRANTPLSLHRFQRLYNVLGGPYSAGASLQRKPLRLIKIIPLNTRPVVYPRLTSALGEVRFKLSHLFLTQPIQIAHHTPNIGGPRIISNASASGRFMGFLTLELLNSKKGGGSDVIYITTRHNLCLAHQSPMNRSAPPPDPQRNSPYRSLRRRVRQAVDWIGRNVPPGFRFVLGLLLVAGGCSGVPANFEVLDDSGLLGPRWRQGMSAVFGDWGRPFLADGGRGWRYRISCWYLRGLFSAG